MIVTDTASYSGIVYGLLTLAGFAYAPQLADLHDQKTLHILRLADEPGYRRQIKVQANLQEGRHALARKIFHGRAGQLYQRYQRYQEGMEDQIGALGLVLIALVPFNTAWVPP